MVKKVNMKPSTILAPVPAVMVSCSDGKEDNIITVAWTGIINSDPPMTYISVRPNRHSYKLIEKSKEFVLNLTSEDLTFEMDHCGCRSGKDEDKFETMHLTKMPADIVKAPLIAESPINIECKVVATKTFESHKMFMAEIVAIHVNENLMTKDGKLDMEKAKLVSLMHGSYYGLSHALGNMGYSVMKPKTAKKKRSEGKKVGGRKPHFTK